MSEAPPDPCIGVEVRVTMLCAGVTEEVWDQLGREVASRIQTALSPFSFHAIDPRLDQDVALVPECRMYAYKIRGRKAEDENRAG